MAQWEYILQCYDDPSMVVGDVDRQEVKRCPTLAEAESVCWSLDCLATMRLRILKIPKGIEWDCSRWGSPRFDEPNE